jgi:hypothetical protein
VLSLCWLDKASLGHLIAIWSVMVPQGTAANHFLPRISHYQLLIYILQFAPVAVMLGHGLTPAERAI